MATTAPRRQYTWQEGFSAALRARDRREKSYDDIISAYTALSTKVQQPAPTPEDHATTTSDELSRLHTELATAQQQQAALTAQVKTLAGVAEKLAVSTKRNKELVEEARGRERELQLARDEMLAMNVELNLVLQREERTQRDNQELVDRWMEHKKREAEEMNRASQWE